MLKVAVFCQNKMCMHKEQTNKHMNLPIFGPRILTYGFKRNIFSIPYSFFGH
jgi:hypothetical protein